MSLTVLPGDCFWIEHGTGAHFFFVISNPSGFPLRDLVIVPMTSVSPEKRIDSCCLFSAGDHPCCTRDSFIDYHRSRRIGLGRLDALLAENKARHRPPPVSAAVLVKLRDGADVSDDLENEVREELWHRGIVRP